MALSFAFRLRGLARTLQGALLTLALACVAPRSSAGFGAPNFDPPEGPYLPRPAAPAQRYAKLDRASCEAELARRGVAFTRVEGAPGVLEPVRLDGALHG